MKIFGPGGLFEQCPPPLDSSAPTQQDLLNLGYGGGLLGGGGGGTLGQLGQAWWTDPRQQMASQTGNANVPPNYWQNVATPIPTEAPYRAITQLSDLDHAVFKTPIGTLVNLWIAKYGTDWVRKSDVVNDEFFGWAVLRLKSASRIEEYQVIDAPSTPSHTHTQQTQSVVQVNTVQNNINPIYQQMAAAGMPGERVTVLRIIDEEKSDA